VDARKGILMSNTIACQFVFEPGEYDDEFHLLDGQIDVFASELSGFISVHRWVSPDGRLKNSIFLKDMESVRKLSKFSSLKLLPHTAMAILFIRN
jgi:hypothetical protein